MAKQKRVMKGPKHRVSKSPYFMQPGKRGQVIVLHRACGNRVVPKVCGNMPSRSHAKMLIMQLEKAESAVKDLFLEATDDGIEALDAVLAACCEEVMKRGPRVRENEGGGGGAGRPHGGGRPPHGSRGPRSRDGQRRPQRGPRPYESPREENSATPRRDEPRASGDRGDDGYGAAAAG